MKIGENTSCQFDQNNAHMHNMIQMERKIMKTGETIALAVLALEGSLCVWHGHHALGMVTMPLVRSPCHLHGLHAFGMVSMHLA